LVSPETIEKIDSHSKLQYKTTRPESILDFNFETMLTTSKSHQKNGLFVLTVGLTMILWIGSKWAAQDWFDNPYKYVAKAASLSATMLMCWCVILSTRWRLLEEWFGGLDKVYQNHKRLGKLSFGLIILHPIFLAMDRLPDAGAFLGFMWFRPTQGDPYLLGQNLGVAAILIMAVLVALTLWVKPPYHLWKKSHEWFGLVLLLTVMHILAVDADVAAYPLLQIWVYAWLLAALAGFVFIRFLYPFLGPHAPFTVSDVERSGQIMEVALSPRESRMDFKPSQFVYLVVRKKGITPEPHPYSIACGYNLEGRIKLGIKQVGDHTRSLDRLQKGDAVDVYGPYGHFSRRFLSGRRDCVFIGGGIGITPFLGMWHVALHSEERLEEGQVPQGLKSLHPEIMRTWQSPCVSLFYVCRTREEASFDNDIRHEVISSHFHGFEAFEHRGHHYELYISSEKGRFGAEVIQSRVMSGIRDKNIFLCGPSPMVDALTAQLQSMGVDPGQIMVEDFNLL